MSKFICLDVIEVGPVYFNPDYIVQFYFDGRNTVLSRRCQSLMAGQK